MSVQKRPHNIFDYFFVSGLSTTSELNVVGNIDELKHAKSFKPSLLHRFPANVTENCWNISVQGTLLQLCHPGGVSVTLQKPADENPKFHSFLLTRDDGFRTYGYVLTYIEYVEDAGVLKNIVKDDLNEKEQSVYAQKCICLISRQAYMNTAEKLLRMLYKIFVVKKKDLKCTNLPVDSYIYNLLFELPIPSIGNSLALKWNSEKPIIVQHPSLSELPLIDINLSISFELVGGPGNFLRLLTSAFLEHQILLVSKDCYKLMQVAEAVTALMFPFQWLHAYAPVLPYKLAHNFLDAPVPYIMGIPLGASEEKLHNRLGSEFDQCFVDLDKRTIDCPEEQPNFPDQVVLTQQLRTFLEKHNKKRSKVANTLNSLSEESEINLLEEEENIIPSPSLRRRNAHKRMSTIMEDSPSSKLESQSVAEIEITDNTQFDAVEELKNLHAVSISPTPVVEPTSPTSELKTMKADEAETQEQLFNIQVRETIFGTLVSSFSQYDKFVILPEVDDSEIGKRWFLTRESQQNFDKASFLSDQPEYRLKFLSAFLETQAFASLCDSCILSQIDKNTRDPNLRLFDDRIKQAKSMPRPENTVENFPEKDVSAVNFLSRSVSTISASQSAKLGIEKWIKNSENALKRRYNHLSGRYPRLRSLKKTEESDTLIDAENTKFYDIRDATFPNILNPELLQERIKGSEQQIFQASSIDPDEEWQELQRTKKRLARQPSMSEFSPDTIAQTNWKFLEKHLRDVKAKTNKLVVRKMGQEAIALGHTESSIMGLEENTLIGSLCDLLERIWGHGLNSNQKKGKSALWTHLLRYEEDSIRIMHVPSHGLISTASGSRIVGLGGHTLSSSDLTKLGNKPLHTSPKLSNKFHESARYDRRYSQQLQVASDEQYITPVPNDIISNIKRIQQLKEVKTNIGKSRAWIRLSLEQKQLHVHLKKLLCNRPLLQTMYKKYSLLRCDDEREQFLYHLMSLNTVDFTCFTNSFTSTMISYRVWIFPKKQLRGFSQTSANVFIMISGELTCTDRIAVPKNCTEFSFQHQNLGVLTTVILSHDNSGMLPKWLVEYVLIRNEVTGQAYYLPCGRWMGRSIEDGSTQRLMLAETVPHAKDLNLFIHEVSSTGGQFDIFPRTQMSSVQDLRDCVGQAINTIIKHFHNHSQDTICPGALTPLLCRPNGLIPVLMKIFQHGLKSSGFFRKQIFAWDVVAFVVDFLNGKITAPKQETSLYRSTLSNIGDFIRNTSPQRSIVVPPQSNSAPSSASNSPKFSGRHEDGAVYSRKPVPDRKVLTQRFIRVVEIILSQREKGLGKDDMFQLLVCVGLKEHCFSEWIQCISAVVKQGPQMYEPHAFICNSQAVLSLSNVLNLDNLSEHSLVFEPILWRGLEDVLNVT